MSRRASLIQRQNPGAKKSVRFPTELVFLESLKDNDLVQAAGMLRRASLKIDINAIADSGLTPLHQAVINENLSAVRLLVSHGADVNARDEDSWTPLHAAAAVGSCDIISLLLQNGADPGATTIFDERPVDLCDSDDIGAIGLLLDAQKKQKASSSFRSIMKKPLVKTNSFSPEQPRRNSQEAGAKETSKSSVTSSGSTYNIKSTAGRASAGVSKIYNFFSSKSNSSSASNNVNGVKTQNSSSKKK